LEQLISTWETWWANNWGESSYSNIYLKHGVWNSWFVPGKRGGRTAEGRATRISTLDTWFGTADFYLGNVVGEQLRREQLISTLDTWFGTADFYLGKVVGEQLGGSSYTVKKVHEFPVSSRDVANQTPPGQE
jgi:hypothetical protein